MAMTDAPSGDLPIKIDSTSNGEYLPIAVSRAMRRARELAAARITDNARRTGQSRRRFLTGLCGAATTLATLNQAFAARGNLGGVFRLEPEATLDPAAAAASLAGDEFIFDVQTHFVDPAGQWRQGEAGQARARGLVRGFENSCARADPVECYGPEDYVKEIFLDSDTDMAVLSFTPGLPDEAYLTIEEGDRVRAIVDAMDGGPRLLLHAMVIPNWRPIEARLADMARVAEQWPVAAWKTYTQWGPEGVGWWLDDPEIGIPFIEQARALGIRNICIHKGLSFGGFPLQYGTCADVGRVARLFPDMNFIIYHSGYEARRREGPYDPANAEAGIDSLVKSLHDNGIAPNSNVYAELGSTWRMVMTDPTAAAHTLGKLLTHVGEDRVLWGTDSIWYGSPQDQIQAFRSFEIAEPLRERYGYPALTPALKAKVFGLNGATVYGVEPLQMRQRASADRIGRMRAAYRAEPDPSLRTYGPRTAAEFRALQRSRGGLPS